MNDDDRERLAEAIWRSFWRVPPIVGWEDIDDGLRDTYRRSADILGAVVGRTHPAPAAVVLWSPDPGPKHLELFEAEADARRFEAETGGDAVPVVMTTWHPRTGGEGSLHG